jgi:hypothetical protein
MVSGLKRSTDWLALVACGLDRPAGPAHSLELGLSIGDQGAQHVGMLLEHGRSFRDDGG